ncbi:MAG: NusG domain II-containing protein [Candidatus Coatesbacteria bacterium]|nr:NusG domain II-containing protein [Candidatus Coatesbacteria bacterium]
MPKKATLIRVGDIVVFIVLGALALFMIWAGAETPKAVANVEIAVSGHVVYSATPGDNFRFEALGPLGKTVIVCQDGYVWVEDSCCSNKLCVKTGKIRTPGQAIVCVPNEVVVRIVGGSDVDAVTM